MGGIPPAFPITEEHEAVTASELLKAAIADFLTRAEAGQVDRLKLQELEEFKNES
jgi:hypothetical protein